MRHVDYVIIGGGISGGTALHALASQGADVLLLERQEHLGGVMRSNKLSGGLIERGPNTIQSGNACLDRLIEELDLTEDLITADTAARNRYVLRDGALFPVPMNPRSLIETGLLSGRAKLRLLRELFAKAPSREAADESVASFVERHFGSEPLLYGVDPFISGIYAGDPYALSLRHTFPAILELEREYGSLIRGGLQRAKKRKREGEGRKSRAMLSFRKGLQTLPRAIEEKWREKIITNADVKPLEHNQDGWRVVAAREGGIEVIRGEKVVLATNAPVAATLVESIDSNLSDTLQQIIYAPIAVAALLYDRDDVKGQHEGFGFLVPSVEKRDILGVIFSSSIFPSRAPQDKVLLTVFIGGIRRPELTELNKDELIRLAHREASDILRIEKGPVDAEVTVWHKAVPQYRVGYDDILEGLAQGEQRNPGLHLLGSYRGGVSVPDCIEQGISLSTSLLEQSSRKPNP